jgi:hypothetical protein
MSTTREAAQAGWAIYLEAKTVETDETDTTREIETEADSVMHTGAGIAGLQTIETTRKTETMTFSVAETVTEIETGTVSATEAGSTR